MASHPQSDTHAALALARQNAVARQIRPWGVSEPHLLSYLMSLSREQFVLPEYQLVAYADTFLPIGYGEQALPPKLVARLLQALQLKTTDKVLEIGAGTGYISALLGHLTKSVVSVERIPELAAQASLLLPRLDIHNVTVETGNGFQGWPSAGPFDVILLSGSVPYLSKALREQLSVNGRLFAVIGQGSIQTAVLLTRVAKAYWTEQNLFETWVPPLKDVPNEDQFVF